MFSIALLAAAPFRCAIRGVRRRRKELASQLVVVGSKSADFRFKYQFFFSCLRLFFLSQTVMEVFLTQDSLPPLPRPERQAKVFKDTRSSPNTVLRGGTSVCAPTFALAFSAHMGCLRLSILACGLAPLAGSKSTAVWAPSAHVASGRPRCSCRGELGWPHVD